MNTLPPRPLEPTTPTQEGPPPDAAASSRKTRNKASARASLARRAAAVADLKAANLAGRRALGLDERPLLPPASYAPPLAAIHSVSPESDEYAKLDRRARNRVSAARARWRADNEIARLRAENALMATMLPASGSGPPAAGRALTAAPSGGAARAPDPALLSPARAGGGNDAHAPAAKRARRTETRRAAAVRAAGAAAPPAPSAPPPAAAPATDAAWRTAAALTAGPPLASRISTGAGGVAPLGASLYQLVRAGAGTRTVTTPADALPAPQAMPGAATRPSAVPAGPRERAQPAGASALRPQPSLKDWLVPLTSLPSLDAWVGLAPPVTQRQAPARPWIAAPTSLRLGWPVGS